MTRAHRHRAGLLALAALALAVWLETEPGIVQGIAWNVLLIGGTSTLLFNGNPLLRFDGYYVLADAIEMLVERRQQTLSADRSAKNPYA